MTDRFEPEPEPEPNTVWGANRKPQPFLDFMAATGAILNVLFWGTLIGYCIFIVLCTGRVPDAGDPGPGDW